MPSWPALLRGSVTRDSTTVPRLLSQTCKIVQWLNWYKCIFRKALYLYNAHVDNLGGNLLVDISTFRRVQQPASTCSPPRKSPISCLYTYLPASTEQHLKGINLLKWVDSASCFGIHRISKCFAIWHLHWCLDSLHLLHRLSIADTDNCSYTCLNKLLYWNLFCFALLCTQYILYFVMRRLHKLHTTERPVCPSASTWRDLHEI
jgi:hypothetical protein